MYEFPNGAKLLNGGVYSTNNYYALLFVQKDTSRQILMWYDLHLTIFDENW
jgi:hypothetical protein